MKEISYEKNLFFRYLILSFLILFLATSSFFVEILINFFNFLSYNFLSLFTEVNLIESKLYIVSENYIFEVIDECLGISAYILIALIFFTIPISYKLSIKATMLCILLFTFFNIVRILSFMLIHLYYGKEVFDSLHFIFYQGLTGIITAFIIIFVLKFFKIKKEYPVFSDMKFLFKVIKK